MRPRDPSGLRAGAESQLIVVHDQPQPCPYLPEQTARMPLRMPVGALDAAALDSLLALGYRRTGEFLYRTECASCQACEPARVLASEFRWTGSLLRVLRRGDAALAMQLGPPQGDAQRVELFNRHRCGRGLAQDDEAVDAAAYRSFLVDSCCESLELSLRLAGRLVAVAIVDVGRDSLSAVYTHFDPQLPRLSLGTYAVLKQIQYAVRTGRSYVYLGMYVARNSHLNYKARFQPQQRLVQGRWQSPSGDLTQPPAGVRE